MNPTGPELRDIHLPADPSWWPPAPGWWILAVLVMGLAICMVIWLHRRSRHRRWQRGIMSEFESIAHDDALKRDPPRLISELSQLLRRAGRLLSAEAATLRGKDWLEFLDSTLATDEFSQGPGRVLLDGPFQRVPRADCDALIDLVGRWMKHMLDDRVHHV